MSYRDALRDLVLAVGNHPDAMIATGDLHTPFMRACAALEELQPCGPEWLPIESAPEGDQTILLNVPTLFGKFNKSIQVAGQRMSDFWVIFNADEAVQRVEPSHWMPLLKQPSATNC